MRRTILESKEDRWVRDILSTERKVLKEKKPRKKQRSVTCLLKKEELLADFINKYTPRPSKGKSGYQGVYPSQSSSKLYYSKKGNETHLGYFVDPFVAGIASRIGQKPYATIESVHDLIHSNCK